MGDKAAAAAKNEIMRGDKFGVNTAAAAKSEIMKGDNKLISLGDKAAAAAKSEIMKGHKLGRQGGNGSQERNYERQPISAIR